MNVLGRLASLAALLLVGCNLTGLAERESAIAVNRCDAETSCGDASCLNERCVSVEGSLSMLLFSVTPTAAVNPLAGHALFRAVSDVPRNGGSYTLALDGLAAVTGSVLATLPSGCDIRFQRAGLDYRQAEDDSIPVRVTFSPSERMLGLPVVTSTVLVRLPDDSVPPPTYRFGASGRGVTLPAGNYDVYIEPFVIKDVSVSPSSNVCSIAPELIRGVAVQGGVDFQHRLPPPAHLELKIKWLERDGTLEDWLVDILEPVTGRVISTRGRLTLPTNTDGALEYTVGIDYHPVLEGEQQVTGHEIVRLSPPPSLVAPSLLFQRSALELFAKGSGVIDRLGAIPAPISLEGRVVDPAKNDAPQQASVTLTATHIAGMPPGALASFTRSAQTEPDGTFRLDVLPGNYRVLVLPDMPLDPEQVPFASLETTWQIAATPARQAGRAISLRPARGLSGAVFTPQGEGARGAVIGAEPSPGSVTTDVFDRALGSLPLVPRATGAVVNDAASGAFTIYADPGIGDRPNLFDFSVRPPASAGFAWLVLPRLPVASGGGDVRLPELSLPAPVRMELAVTLAGSAAAEELFAGANVRVYALLDVAGVPTTDPTLVTSAVSIAEASLDAGARATVLLPPSLNRP